MLKIFGRKKKESKKPPLAAGGGDDSELEYEEHKDEVGEELDGDAMYHHDDDMEEDQQFDDDGNDDDSDHVDEPSEEDSEDFRGKPSYAKEFEDDNSTLSQSVEEDGASRAYSEMNEGDGYCYGYFGGPAGDGKITQHHHDEEVKENAGDDIATMKAANAARNAKFTRFLGKDEKVRASQVFKLLDVHKEGKIDNEGFATALSLLGMKITANECNELFLSRGFDLVDEETFVSMVGEYRAADDEQIRQIEGAFEDLYRGILAEREGGFVEQRDGIGRPYILASDLRNLLVSSGDTLTDEEADRLISDCKPIYKVHSDGSVTGKIFFEQYRAMLLPGPH